MKYKLLRDLPFMESGTIFGTGSWTSGGYGVDLGETHYKEGGSSHNGVRTFEKYENKLLEELLAKKDWIEKIPQDEYEVLSLFKEGYLDNTKAREYITYKKHI